MKILYSTDLHGHKKKYQTILNLIDTGNYDLCIIGADILPKHQTPLFEFQKSFIMDYLSNFLSKIHIPLIIDFGNDDLYCFYSLFKQVVNEFQNIYISHINTIKINELNFVGMHYVPDYPFGLKDWCRRDDYLMSHPEYISRPVYSTLDGLEPIEDINDYFQSKLTIKEELNNLKLPKDFIFLSHSPPKTIGLDVTSRFDSVGSYSITNFIIDQQPLISLHGHIHESPWKSDISINKIVNTVCVNPGQIGRFEELVYCEFDTNNIEETYQRKEIECKKQKNTI